MMETVQPGPVARRVVLRRAIGVGVGSVVTLMTMRASAGSGPGVVVDNFAFVPSVLQLKAGTTLTWTNHDEIPHSIVCPTLGVRSHPMDTNESFSYTFSKAGEFTYVCGLHPFMHGKVVVTA